jgi:prepilin-type N-terminal cleavage/methylation domain-containing protein
VRRGVTLVEMMVVAVLLAMLLSIAGVLFHGLHEAHDRTAAALSDLEAATRFLECVRHDARHATRAEAVDGELRLELPGGPARWRFADGVATSGTGREFRGAFQGVVFARDGRLVTVTVELRRRDGSSAFRPRISTAVYCPNLEER